MVATIVQKRIVLLNPEKVYPIFDLKRSTTMPLNEFYSKHLEEMSFIKIFPYGINGYNTSRIHKVTASAYGKARVMSSDTRYQSIEYMFYILAKIESEKITSNMILFYQPHISKKVLFNEILKYDSDDDSVDNFETVSNRV